MNIINTIRLGFIGITCQTLLQTQDLRANQEKGPCIGFIQENSIENSI